MPRRSDANQLEIMDALRKAGATVHDTHGVGWGFPDIVVGYLGLNFLMEIKVPGGKLDNKQRAWHSKWRGQAVVVHSEDEALAALEAIASGTWRP